MSQGFGIAKQPELPRERARNLVFTMAALGDHRQQLPFGANRDMVRAFFEQHGVDYDKLVEDARNPSFQIPLVESLIPANWTITGGFQIVDGETGAVQADITAPSTVSLSTYRSHFDQAVASVNASIERGSLPIFLQGIASGFGSIESFLNTAAEEWNAKHPDQQLIDKKQSFEARVAEWMKTISGGEAYDKGQRDWQSLMELKDIRDDMAMHPKKAAQAIAFEEMAKFVNLFYGGVATTLFRMHILIKKRIPCSIIRAKFTPEVEVV
jgi:hypothetical protein